MCTLYHNSIVRFGVYRYLMRSQVTLKNVFNERRQHLIYSIKIMSRFFVGTERGIIVTFVDSDCQTPPKFNKICRPKRFANYRKS